MRTHPRTNQASQALVVLLLAALAGIGPTLVRPAPASAVDDPFATRCGTRICLDGEEHYVAGAKAYDPFTFGSGSGDTEAEHMDKARIDAHFARMRDDGVDVARLRMFSHEDWRGFEKGEGVYSEQQFVASPPARTT
ncbi:hypothetical protein [Streptomyces mutomycini]|uniref:Uncharacterized protein n=1 Tax=Streptomyces mutomycini TaxID=284036 RepID=A0ABW0B6W9_9ACTN|nr:hypothetical protein [Streptomyces mutomycini]